MTTTDKKNQLEFEELKDKLYIIENNGDMFKLDFDNNGVLRVGTSQPPTNQKKKT